MVQIVEGIKRLYHGSKNGIEGDIQPKSRERCDFGCGFYLGDKPDQPKGLISQRLKNKFYEIDYDFTGLNIKEFGESYIDKIDWALFIAYNREPELFKEYNLLKDRYRAYNEGYDVIIGYIADDSMMTTLTDFFKGITSDKEMIDCLAHVKLGKQYVLKNKKACETERLKIVECRPLTSSEIKLSNAENQNRKKQMDSIIMMYKTKYRRDMSVKYIDEIMKEWNGNVT